MATIGSFTKSDNGFIGSVRTLSVNVKARITAETDKDKASAPDYLSVKLDDPSFAAPIYASLMTAEDGDTRWKVPGVLDWASMTHNPFADITKETTTLYASDRDVFLFLVDDTHPIEAGKLADGSPDLYFRGFYCWNSEVGSKSLGIASFYLRAVCQNRNLWGVEGFEQITIRHSKFAAQRFAHEAAPALTNFAESSPAPFVAGITAARARTVARSKAHQDSRLDLEGKAKRLLEQVV